jgi:hypothetical protein
LACIPKKDVIQIRMAVCVIFWAMWNVQNDFTFNKPRQPTFMQVIPMDIHWIRMWSYFKPVEERHCYRFWVQALVDGTT